MEYSGVLCLIFEMVLAVFTSANDLFGRGWHESRKVVKNVRNIIPDEVVNNFMQLRYIIFNNNVIKKVDFKYMIS